PISNSGPSSSHVPNGTRLEAIGQAVDARQGGPRHRQRVKRSRGRIILVTLATVVVVIVAAVVGDYWYINHLIKHVTITSESQQYNNTENILLVGSTTRCGLKHQNAAYGLCSQGVTGVNSDVVMILHLNLTTNQVS